MNNSQVDLLTRLFLMEMQQPANDVDVSHVPTDVSLIHPKLVLERDWKPYCLKCNTMARMGRRTYGFECLRCHNTINWDMSHYTPPEEA